MSRPRRILAGDIGGTKTLLRLAELEPGATGAGRAVAESRYASGDYADLAPMLDDFLDGQADAVDAACLAVAGPVQGDRAQQTARLTNLPWALDSQRIGAALGGVPSRLVNDFQAVGYGIDALGPDDLAPLQDRAPEPGRPRVVVGAGTGLGVTLLFWSGDHYEAVPTEGGHADFAPTDARQEALLRHLRGRYGRVSWERVVSGPGLAAIYRFLLEEAGGDAATDPVLTAPDPAAAVSERADTDPRAGAALELFLAAYGTVAGNLALTCLAYGGVYIAGGIAPRLLDRMREGPFLEAFTAKGRMRPLVEAMPVRVVTEPQVGLLGAVVAAGRL